MKTIKVILGIITALVVAFFITGLLVKETTYTSQVSVNKPIEEVFNLFNDSSKIKNWIPELKSIAVINETSGKTGSTYQMVVEDKEKEVTITEKVLAFVPNEKVTLHLDVQSMLKIDDYSFTEQNRVTTVLLSSTCKSDSYIMSCLLPYFKGVIQKEDQTHLNNFKAFAEK